MRYLLIEFDDGDSTKADLGDIACDIADFVSDDLGVVAQVIYPIPSKIMEAIEELI